MKRYAAKVTGNGATTFHASVEDALLYAFTNGGGRVWRAADKTKGGRWKLVQEVIPV